ncbi:MAG TPA: M28 family peptidase [Nitrolancea sp.]|nr:M28 family peptidase [Nitrolancea sp.]
MTAANTPYPQALGGALLGEVSAERLMDYDRNIAQWVRLSGSEDEAKAFDYVDKTLQSWGIQTERYAPVCLVSWPGPATLTILGSGQSLDCITHSFSTATGPDGLTAEVVYAGGGAEADYAGKDVAGKIVLTEGLAGPAKVAPAERHGALGVINISGDIVHEMIVSPVWGSPTPETVGELPHIPHISITTEAGERLKEELARGPVRVRITTEVDTAWRPLPVLVGHVTPSRPSAFADEYVMFSGHIDSWHYGAMDNGSANATQMEVARILAGHRDLLKRELRLAFWSGHSHARYGSSAWFADEFFYDLSDHCVAHVNIDGPGALNATVLTNAPTMAESYPLAREVIQALSGQELAYRRIGRMGDQSFWGVGIPAFFCGLSSQGPSPESDALAAGRSHSTGRRSGGTAWWWHTTEDTIDKIDPELLARDCRILLATVYRLVTDPVVALDQAAAVDEIQRSLAEIAGAAGDAFDLAAVADEAEGLLAAARRLQARCQQPATDEQAHRLNACLMRLSRLLLPVNYTMHGPFEQDLALQYSSLPGLRPAATLAALPPHSQERHLLEVKLRRERNRVRHALREARATVEQTLAAVG